MLATIDIIRKEASKQLDQSKRGELGQFMTPMAVAEFMASLFSKPSVGSIHLLDAGAGIGSLTAAFFDNALKNWSHIEKVELTAYEIDNLLSEYLNANIRDYKALFNEANIELNETVLDVDFICDATLRVKADDRKAFTHAILNPPYKKIHSASAHRKLLSSTGLETVNLYSAFVALALMLLKNNGELVAIIPRSFCNGNYYKPFRKFIIDNAVIKQIHLFESRTQAFKDDDVLQENVIIHLRKGGHQENVVITRSANSSFHDLSETVCAFDQIVKSDDQEYFIHIPASEENCIENSDNANYSLSEIGLEVSTGPVVDFRSKEHIYMETGKNTVPLLYPSHFNCKEIDWPKQGKKPNAIALNEQTIRMLYPSGFYTVVKRFSSKEEKQRIVARVINPKMLTSKYIGLENHLNVFHSKKKGIDGDLAYGLAAYLNSSFVDIHFRSYNGHTQVNATDLKQMKYPPCNVLVELGKWARTRPAFDQSEIDKKIKKFL